MMRVPPGVIYTRDLYAFIRQRTTERRASLRLRIRDNSTSAKLRRINRALIRQTATMRFLLFVTSCRALSLADISGGHERKHANE